MHDNLNDKKKKDIKIEDSKIKKQQSMTTVMILKKTVKKI